MPPTDPAPPQTDPAAPAISIADWLDRLRAQLPAGRDLSLSASETAALLDLARVAAHTSERKAAPLSTFLAGVAFGARPPAERADRIAALAEELEGAKAGVS